MSTISRTLFDYRSLHMLNFRMHNVIWRREFFVIYFLFRFLHLCRLCCVERPIASQVIISKTIANPSKLKSVTEKIALQINCKLGGALWTVTLPLVLRTFWFYSLSYTFVIFFSYLLNLCCCNRKIVWCVVWMCITLV